MIKARKTISLGLALCVLALLLTGCGLSLPGKGDPDKFLEDMAEGLSNREKNLDDEQERTEEEMAKYRLRAVDYELEMIEKYDSVTFPDEKFNALAHAYINACKLQRFSAENIKNKNLFPSLWGYGYLTRLNIILELYSHYDLPITAEHFHVYEESYQYYYNLLFN